MGTAEGFNQRFEEYIDKLYKDLHRANWCGRREILHGYCRGLLLPRERKSMEPIAVRMDPSHARASREAVQQFITDSNWDYLALLGGVQEYALPLLLRTGSMEAWIIDDTAFPKSGSDSVGVARQWCGTKGKQDNCQDAVSISVANRETSLPCAFRLYLPEAWCKDAAARKKVGVPESIRFQTKCEIAADLVLQLRREGVAPAPVLADSAYGDNWEFREFLTTLEMPYVVAIKSGTTVWAPGTRPLPPKPWAGRGLRPNRLRVDPDHPPKTVIDLAMDLRPGKWKIVTWEEGARGSLKSRFAALRVRCAHRTEKQVRVPPLQWLLIEWPDGKEGPTDFWFSTLPAGTPITELVRMAKLRWRIERDYQVLKDQLGLDHFEGRTWRGFHRHASLAIAAYAFLLAEDARLSPPTIPETLQRIQFDLSRSHPWTPPPRPRGAPCDDLPGDPPDPDCPGSDRRDGPLSLLRKVGEGGGQGRLAVDHA
jgi:SRSO17 transposase